jgi:hypothetical protein
MTWQLKKSHYMVENILGPTHVQGTLKLLSSLIESFAQYNGNNSSRIASDDSDHCPLFLVPKDNLQARKGVNLSHFGQNLRVFRILSSRLGLRSSASHAPLETLLLKFKAAAKGLQSWSDKKVGHFKTQLERDNLPAGDC